MNAEKHFGSRNLYHILQLNPDASINDGKSYILYVEVQMITLHEHMLLIHEYFFQ